MVAKCLDLLYSDKEKTDYEIDITDYFHVTDTDSLSQRWPWKKSEQRFLCVMCDSRNLVTI